MMLGTASTYRQRPRTVDASGIVLKIKMIKSAQNGKYDSDIVLPIRRLVMEMGKFNSMALFATKMTQRPFSCGKTKKGWSS